MRDEVNDVVAAMRATGNRRALETAGHVRD
jgi:hypothetical protein